MRSNWDDVTLDTRVSVRMRWDKSLAEASIQVSTVSEGVVELKGKVASLQQRRRAIEIAQKRGCQRVELTSSASRKDARRFYERLGFVASHVGMKLMLK